MIFQKGGRRAAPEQAAGLADAISTEAMLVTSLRDGAGTHAHRL
ncbi:hypothetical protein [Streptomyces anulatus]|nr:hypothetical protein [Streptomyces anulatus]